MEHEKKKRQKKKKNKQGKANERPPSGVGEPISDNNNHSNVNIQNQNSENPDVYNKQRVVDSDRESISGAETSHSVEAENSYSLSREASLQQKIKELQEQLEVHVLREADLERNISQSQKEINLWHHKETEFETRIFQLQTEKDSWLQKEAGYQEKVSHLIEEANTLNKDNARLQAQVMDMEASGRYISQQNQQLKDNVTHLHSKIQDLENSLSTQLSSQSTKNDTENEEMKSQLESARALIEKLVSENEKLIEKVNYLNAELDGKSVTTTDSSLTNKADDDPMVTNSEVDGIDETEVETSATETDHKVIGAMKDDVVRLKSNNSSNYLNRVSMESGEIVQISLDENDATSTEKAKAGGDSDSVPLTDAPLIGAPFRFISLVARYVSGADLVEKS